MKQNLQLTLGIYIIYIRIRIKMKSVIRIRFKTVQNPMLSAFNRNTVFVRDHNKFEYILLYCNKVYQNSAYQAPMKRGVCTFVDSQPTSTLHSPSIRMRLLRSDNLRGKLPNFYSLRVWVFYLHSSWYGNKDYTLYRI